MRDAIAKLEALSLEAKQNGFIMLAHKLDNIINDMCAIQDGLDMEPTKGA